MPKKTKDEQVMDELLRMYDWQIRLTTGDDDYQCGYADAIGQTIINLGKVFGAGVWSVEKQETSPYKYEALKRVMHYTNQKDYWKKYPKPLASYFPAETIRKYGGKL